jgi:hypothetical protein
MDARDKVMLKGFLESLKRPGPVKAFEALAKFRERPNPVKAVGEFLKPREGVNDGF